MDASGPHAGDAAAWERLADYLTRNRTGRCVVCNTTARLQEPIVFLLGDHTYARRQLCADHRLPSTARADDPYLPWVKTLHGLQRDRLNDIRVHPDAWPDLVDWIKDNPKPEWWRSTPSMSPPMTKPITDFRMDGEAAEGLKYIYSEFFVQTPRYDAQWQRGLHRLGKALPPSFTRMIGYLILLGPRPVGYDVHKISAASTQRAVSNPEQEQSV